MKALLIIPILAILLGAAGHIDQQNMTVTDEGGKVESLSQFAADCAAHGGHLAFYNDCEGLPK